MRGVKRIAPKSGSRPLGAAFFAGLLILAALGHRPQDATAAPAWQLAQSATPDTQTLKGAAAWAAMVGSTITGTTPDGEYAEYFNPDGRFVHVDHDGAAPGTWTLKGEEVCFAYPDEEEVECRKPELTGTAGAFMGADGARYPFALLPGNPRKL